MPHSAVPKGITSPQSEYAKRLYKMARTDAISLDVQARYAAILNQRSRALLQMPSLPLVAEAGRVHVYQGVCPHEGTVIVKGSTTMDGLLSDIIAKLEKRSESSLEFKKFMYGLFGDYFCHAINISLAEALGDRASTHAADRVRVHWLSLFEDTKRPPFDVVFASKTNLYTSVDGAYVAHGSHGPALPDVGTLTWDSFPNLATFREVDTGCRRLHLYKSGFVVERTANVASCRISLVLSFREPYVPEWTRDLLGNLHAFANPPAHFVLVPPGLWSYNEYCYVCFKSFRFFRRRHHCRLCGNAVCSKCSFSTIVPVAKEKKSVLSCVKCGPKATAGNAFEARLTASASAVHSMRRSASSTQRARLKTAASDNSLLTSNASRLSIEHPPRLPPSRSDSGSSFAEKDADVYVDDPRLHHRSSDPALLRVPMGNDGMLLQVERRKQGSRRQVAAQLVNSSPAAYHRGTKREEEFAYNQGFTARSIDSRPPHRSDRSQRRGPTGSDGLPKSSDGNHRRSDEHRRHRASGRRGIVSPPAPE
ncbi:hypothetical protein ACHHYP_01233 [Achlya hypogyna]|uniref:FYVE-type domain-containing protein n=1 Tax=Achlya hypogyna TaxID=1202772 RepID=A0A1V9Z931_ACHHY|nr:hypothetical protein ACHHYP_01233 [Achlya hypogyna]